MSRVLFWTLVGGCRHIILLNSLATIASSRVATETEWVAFTKAPIVTRIVLYALVALSLPLALSGRTIRDSKKSINRDSLRLLSASSATSLRQSTSCYYSAVFLNLMFRGDAGRGCLILCGWYGYYHRILVVLRKNLIGIMRHSFPMSIRDEARIKRPSLGSGN
jgi:hypothetical protein